MAFSFPLAVTAQIALGPEDQQPENWEVGYLSKATSEQSPPPLTCLSCSATDATQHPRLHVEVKAVNLTTGTRGLHTPGSPRQACP